MSKYLIFVWLLMPVILQSCKGEFDCMKKLRSNPKISEDGRLSFTGLAAKYGHPAEEHEVLTQDGYYLSLFHLPGPDPAKVALLVHGNSADADVFIVRGSTSLAITMANDGYDVWVINLRGTAYSNRHVSLDPVKDHAKFNDFSFYEQGIYDIPATVDYILNHTNQTKLLIIGHSFGTTATIVLGAEKPEYNDKIKALIALAPVCFNKHQKGSSRVTSFFGYVSDVVAKLVGVSKVGGCSSYGDYLSRSTCLNLNPAAYNVCVRGNLFAGSGYDEAGFEPEFMPTLFGHFPGYASRKGLVHYSQIFLRDSFAKFDYGVAENVRLYKSIFPPVFDLSRVTMKVAIFVGNNDFLSTVPDVARLRDRLPNVVHYKILPYKKFNHIDFTFGRHVNTTLNPFILPVIEKYITEAD